MSDQQPKRTPLKGSCHCGAVRYILFLTLPHPHPGGQRPPQGSQIFRRCNCTTCHKMAFFHVRPVSNHDDFLLLSPLDPLNDLGNYTHGDKMLHFMFCKTCGVRVFMLHGESVVEEVDLAELGVPGAEKGQKIKAWRVSKEGQPDYGNNLSVNGHTIDAGQGFDMRELTEKKMVLYLDTFDEVSPGKPSFEKPHIGGCY